MLQEWLLDLGSSPWLYVGLYVFCAIDGFFPPVPSESVVIALAATSAATGQPQLAFVVLAAAAGAFTGDQIAYTIGSRFDVRTLRIMRSSKAQSALDWAENALRQRGPSFIIAARYVPVGRVAVNMTAGSLGYRRRRFSLLVGIAAVLWALYGVALGVGAGTFLHDRPVLAVVVGVVVGIVVGLALDPLIRLFTRGRDADPFEPALEHSDARSPGRPQDDDADPPPSLGA